MAREYQCNSNAAEPSSQIKCSSCIATRTPNLVPHAPLSDLIHCSAENRLKRLEFLLHPDRIARTIDVDMTSVGIPGNADNMIRVDEHFLFGRRISAAFYDRSDFEPAHTSLLLVLPFHDLADCR